MRINIFLNAYRIQGITDYFSRFIILCRQIKSVYFCVNLFMYVLIYLCQRRSLCILRFLGHVNYKLGAQGANWTLFGTFLIGLHLVQYKTYTYSIKVKTNFSLSSFSISDIEENLYMAYKQIKICIPIKSTSVIFWFSEHRNATLYRKKGCEFLDSCATVSCQRNSVLDKVTI